MRHTPQVLLSQRQDTVQESKRTTLLYVSLDPSHYRPCGGADSVRKSCHLVQRPPSNVGRDGGSIQVLLAIPGIGDLLEGLAAYTQNHHSRVARLQRSAYLLDYTLASMDVLTPTTNVANADAEADVPPRPGTPPQTQMLPSQQLASVPGQHAAKQYSKAAAQVDAQQSSDVEAADAAADEPVAEPVSNDAVQPKDRSTPHTAKRKRRKSAGPTSAKATSSKRKTRHA